MFQPQKEGQWEPYKIRVKGRQQTPANQSGSTEGANGDSDEITLEEDIFSEDGAVWPVTAGQVTNWSCFYALMSHVFNALNPPFHTPVLLISQPSWTARDREKLRPILFRTVQDTCIWSYGRRIGLLLCLWLTHGYSR